MERKGKDNFRSLLGIRKIHSERNLRIIELCGVTKGVERTDENGLRCFGYIKRMGKDRITKQVCVGTRLVDRHRKKWIDSVNDCKKV